MQSGASGLDAVVNKVFSKDVQQKRAKKELESLQELDPSAYRISLQTTSLGLRIIVEIGGEFLLQEIPNLKVLTFPIIFEFLMDQGFPFNSPKIYAKTNFYQPSLADGRDYLNEIIKKNWNPAILLKDIIPLLPQFLKRVEELPRPEDSQLLGEFHPGSVFSLEDYISRLHAAVFPGEEILLDKGGATAERFFIVAEGFFLAFESFDKARNTIKLVSWIHVQSIANIKKSKEDKRKLVMTLIDKKKQSGVVQNVYLVDEAKVLVEALVQSGQKYGIKVTKSYQKRDLTMSEVTVKSYEDMNIEELLDNITYLESQLETNITIDVVNLLMNLYQKAVEYFSAFNDPVYNDFMMRLHGLLQREDVQVVLQSKQDEKVKPNEKTDRIGLQEDDEEEKTEDLINGFYQNNNTSVPNNLKPVEESKEAKEHKDKKTNENKNAVQDKQHETMKNEKVTEPEETANETTNDSKKEESDEHKAVNEINVDSQIENQEIPKPEESNEKVEEKEQTQDTTQGEPTKNAEDTNI